jgi:cell division protein ZapA (FtsZ GTPase activity inhibitor)
MKVQIAIRGRTYTVRSDQDEDLPAIAAFVDRKMSEIGGPRAGTDEYTVALLTALNIASEFERFRRSMDAELSTLERELASVAMLLESARGEEAAP